LRRKRYGVSPLVPAFQMTELVKSQGVSESENVSPGQMKRLLPSVESGFFIYTKRYFLSDGIFDQSTVTCIENDPGREELSLRI
jgi:hypothetical protein